MGAVLGSKFHRRKGAASAFVVFGLLAMGCSNAESQLEVSAVTVAGVTTTRSSTTTEIPPTTQEGTTTTAPDPLSSVESPGELDPVDPTGLSVPLISFDDAIRLIEPDGSVTLLARDDAVRVAGDTRGGVLFQRELVEGPQSSLLWQPAGAIVPQAVFVPDPDQKVELHGVTTVTAQPEVVFSVTSESSTNRSLNRLDPATGVITELAVVDDAEFGSKSTQVDGLFIVTTWQRPDAAGWTVYQSGTGREIGGSFPDVEAACADGEGLTCARLASLSLDIELVFRIVPHDVPAQPGRYDLLVSRSENGSTVTRVDLTSLEGVWFPEHLSELPAGKILLSRSVDPNRLRPTTGVVIDPASGSVESLNEIGFVRLP